MGQWRQDVASVREPPATGEEQEESGWDWEDLPEELEEEARSLWQRTRPWLIAAAIFGVLCVMGLVAGNQFHKPESRIPHYNLGSEQGLLGVNEPVRAQLARVSEALPQDGPIVLEPFGDVYELDFPRSVADRLFGERDESALVFSARTDDDTELRFMALMDGEKPPAFAVGPISSSRGGEGPQGLFLALVPVGDAEGPLAGLTVALEAVLDDLDDLPSEELSSDSYTVFGPFGGGDPEVLRSRVASNVVLAHLAGALDAAESDVSLTAPAFLVRPAPGRGTINALYQPSMRLVQAPLWGESSTASFAHELVHAYMDRVLTNAEERLQEAVAYFDAAHPRLFGEVVGDLYERLSPEGRAEEAIAFVTGSVAAGQTRTVETARLLQYQGSLDIAEPILQSDIELLVGLGLLPSCMAPDDLGFEPHEVTFEFYEAVREACG